jgi:hypothetical protein
MNTSIATTIEISGIPPNFLIACENNAKKALCMYQKSLKRRKDFNVDLIASTPQLPLDHFHSILKFYPHYLHGYARDGCAVLYEVLGKADPKKLRNSGVNTDELVWHFVLRNEFALNCYKDKKQQQQKESVTKMMTVNDVEGISVSSVTSEVISFIKRSSDIVDNYYPQRE